MLVMRLPQHRTVISGGSACGICGHRLGARDLVPVLSWVALRNRCRYCRAGIGLFYPGIELAAVAIALWAATLATGTLLWVSCGLGWVLLALASIDAREGLLPDFLTLPLVLAGLAAAQWLEPDALLARAIGAVAGFAVFWSVALLYRGLRHRDGLGLGDAKLLAAAGAWLGWEALPSIVLVAAIAGLSTALASGLAGRRIAYDTKLPFGPALCLGFWLVWLYGVLQ